MCCPHKIPVLEHRFFAMFSISQMHNHAQRVYQPSRGGFIGEGDWEVGVVIFLKSPTYNHQRANL